MLTSDCSGGVIVSSPGDIVLVQQTLTGNLAMRSQEVNPMTVLNEVRILKSECHPCIINLKNVIDKPNFLFIVMDLAEEGEHFYKIIEKAELNEAKLHFLKIASGISTHRRSVIEKGSQRMCCSACQM